MISGYILSHDLLPLSEVEYLKSNMGALGYGLLWSLLDMLVASDAHSIVVDYDSLACEMRCDADTLRSVVEDYALFTVTDGTLSCPALTADIERHHARSIKRSERAKKAALARWGKDATSTEDRGCSAHKKSNADSIEKDKVAENEGDNATGIASRACAPSRARAKRNNTSYSVSQSNYKPEMLNYPPLTPPSFAAQKNGVAKELEEGGEFETLRGELRTLREELATLAKKLGGGDRSATLSPKRSGEEFISKLEEPWQRLVRDWVTYRGEIGSPIRGRLAVSKFYDRLRQLSGGDISSARQIIDRSIANGYKGIELRTSGYVSSGYQKTDAAGRVIDSTVGQDYTKKRSIRDCFKLREQGLL